MERIAIRTDVLAFAHCQHVISRAVVEQGRQALRVELAPGLGPEAVFQKPTFVVTSAHLTDGIIEADILARRSRNALPVSKASAGLAYRITGSGQVFEAVHLRPINGHPMKPNPPLDRQAVQYFACPDASRSSSPDPAYEAGADIRPDTWINLKLEIKQHGVTTYVDGALVLQVQSRVPPGHGAMGPWVFGSISAPKPISATCTSQLEHMA